MCSGFPRLGVLRRLRPAPDRSAVDAPSPTQPAGRRRAGRDPGRFPCSLWFARRRRSPTMSLRHRHEYAADLPRGLPGRLMPTAREFPATTRRRVRTAPGPDPPGSSRCRIKGTYNAGSSRTPLRPARRTRTIWQYWPVPALSGLLPPSPAPPGSGCPQLHRPAATGRRRRSLTSTRTTAPHGARTTCGTPPPPWRRVRS